MKKIPVGTQGIELYGLPWYAKNGCRTHRLPDTVRDAVSLELWDVAQDTAGARIRFLSDTGTCGLIFEAVNYNERKGEGTGALQNYLMGFDLYADGCFWKNAVPAHAGENEVFFFRDTARKKRLFEIYLPMHLSVNDIRVILDDDASLWPDAGYAGPPLVFYGTSITQGYSVSRPGQAYPCQVSRAMGRDIVNYGFSGAGRGEAVVAHVVAETQASCYILDFGQTCESLREFRQNLSPFVEIVRACAPDTPILLTTPIFYLQENWDEELQIFQRGRREIVEEVYASLHRMDPKLHLLRWNEKAPFKSGCAQTDGAHANDLGAYWMSCALCEALKEFL